MRTNSQGAQRVRGRKHALSTIGLAVLLTVVPNPLKAQEITLTRVIVQNDKNEFVRSEIVYFLPTAPLIAIPLDETDGQRDLTPYFDCPRGTKIRAQPIKLAYNFSIKKFCRPTLDLVVERKTVSVQLQENLDTTLAWKDYATAVLITNELAAIETRDGNGVFGSAAEDLAVIYAEKAFGVTGGFVFDDAQKKVVMTLKLQAKVHEYQSQNGLEETGQLDYNTVSTLAGTSSSVVRYTAYEANQM